MYIFHGSERFSPYTGFGYRIVEDTNRGDFFVDVRVNREADLLVRKRFCSKRSAQTFVSKAINS